MEHNSKTNWQRDEIVTENDMNRIEQGIKDVNSKLDVFQNDINTKINNIEEKLNNIPLVTKLKNGLMSKEDKVKLDAMFLQEVKLDLYNAGQSVPWTFIKSDSECSGNIDFHSMNCIIPMPNSGTNYGGFCTINKLDITNWKYIKFDRGNGGSSRLDVDYKMIVSSDNTPSFTSNIVAYLETSKDGNIDKDIHDAINITNIEGSYYIKILCSSRKTNYGQAGHLSVYKVYLENVN